MIPLQRHEVILSFAQRRPVVTVSELVGALGVSHMTVRRDLAELVKAGELAAVRGGVTLPGPRRVTPTLRASRSAIERESKARIAAAAAARVRTGMCVYLDSGTTCESLATLLRPADDLTIVTPDIVSAAALAQSGHASIMTLGGRLDPETLSELGAIAERTVASINFDIAFLGTAAWSLDAGVTVSSVELAALKVACVAQSRSSILLADGSKFGETAPFSVAPLAELQEIITDARLSRADVKAVAEVGATLSVAD